MEAPSHAPRHGRLQRELSPLRAITDAFPKCVITLDRYGLDATSDGIKVLGAIDWLLGR